MRLKQTFPKSRYSLSNSGGIFLGQNYHFDMVRVGGLIYGININNAAHKTYNVVKYYARVYDRKILSRKSTIGYDATYHAKKGDKLLVINVGYADGFANHLNHRHWAMYKNIKLPVIGKISMNLVTLCANQLENNVFFEVQYVELLGENNDINVISSIANVNPRQILSGLGNTKNKIYIS